jgi:hypothetical protein
MVPKNAHGIGDVLQQSKRKGIVRKGRLLSHNRTRKGPFIAQSTTAELPRGLPTGLQSVLQRAMESRKQCGYTVVTPSREQDKNSSHLPHFGIIEALDAYSDNSDELESKEWQCQVPPDTECDSSKFTVIFMGYRPDQSGP